MLKKKLQSRNLMILSKSHSSFDFKKDCDGQICGKISNVVINGVNKWSNEVN